MNEIPNFEKMYELPEPELIVKTTHGELHFMDAKKIRTENGIIPMVVVYNSRDEVVFLCSAADLKLAYKPN